MGSSNSRSQNLSTNKHLVDLCSDVPYNTGHDFWKQMLNSAKLISNFEEENIELAEQSCSDLLAQLSKNNIETRNIQTLERILTSLLTAELNSDSTQAAITGLVVFRFIMKYLLNSKDEQNLNSIILGKDPMIKDFLNACFSLMAGDITCDNMEVLVETEAFLLLCITSQRFGISTHLSQHLCDSIFNLQTQYNNSLNIANNVIVNVLSVYCAYSSFLNKEQEGLIFRARKGLYNTLTWNDSSENQCILPDACQLSAHLVCLLIHWPLDTNIYRTSLQQLFLFDASGDKCVQSDLHKAMELCQNLCQSSLCNEDGILLLYTLLYNCKYFRSFFISRANIDEMVSYILKIIYDVQTSNPHHHSMCLVILLMLSEDTYFSNYLHETVISIPRWYKDHRCISSMTAGNFVYIIILNQLKRNFIKSKDRYLNNNCVGILCNLSHEFKQMHWFVCQKLMDTLKCVFRLYQSNLKLTPNSQHDETNDDITITKELILVLIDVMNIIICKHYISNVDLLYSMLYENKFMMDLKENISLLAMNNLYKITSYLNDISHNVKWSSEDSLKSIIQSKIKLFPASQLTSIKEIRFHYTEQADSSRFFLPYIWALVYDSKYLGSWPSEEFKIIEYLP